MSCRVAIFFCCVVSFDDFLCCHVSCCVVVREVCHLSRQQCQTDSGRLTLLYRRADKSLARPTSRSILFDGENISFDASLVIYMYSTNIPPIMIINRIYEHQNLLSL